MQVGNGSDTTVRRILVSGRAAVNRAVHGDTVAVRLLPRWVAVEMCTSAMRHVELQADLHLVRVDRGNGLPAIYVGQGMTTKHALHAAHARQVLLCRSRWLPAEPGALPAADDDGATLVAGDDDAGQENADPNAAKDETALAAENPTEEPSLSGRLQPTGKHLAAACDSPADQGSRQRRAGHLCCHKRQCC